MKSFRCLLYVFCCISFFCGGDEIRIPQFQKVDLKLDGIPNESFWNKSGKITDFRKFRNPSEKTSGTAVRICMDNTNLYIGLICEEPKGIFTGNPNGSAWAGDNVEIFLASLKNGDWYRQIVIGLNGKRYQEFIPENQYQSAVHLGEKKWSAEIVVPLKSLGKFSSDSLRFNMLRYRKNAREFSSWQNIFWAHDADKFGHLIIFKPEEEVTHGPWTFGITDSCAGINWETSGKIKTAFSFRKKGEKIFRKKTAEPGNTKYHSVFLKNLLPDTEYEYQTGNGTVYSFRTLTPENADFSFTVTTDIHGRSGMLKEILKNPNVQQSDMIFLLGDMMSAMIGRYSCYEGFLDTIVENWKKPFYCIRGNHEYRGAGANVFFDLFSPLERKSYGAFSHKGIFFLFLDTDGDVKESSSYMKNQKEWLCNVVKSKEFLKAKFRILLVHKPLMLPSQGGGTELKKLFDTLSEKEKRLFDLSLSGHTHHYSKTIPGTKKLYAKHKTKNGMSPVLSLAFPVMTNDLGGFFLAEKKSSHLLVKVFDETGKIIDEIKLTEKQ